MQSERYVYDSSTTIAAIRGDFLPLAMTLWNYLEISQIKAEFSLPEK